MGRFFKNLSHKSLEYSVLTGFLRIIKGYGYNKHTGSFTCIAPVSLIMSQKSPGGNQMPPAPSSSLAAFPLYPIISYYNNKRVYHFWCTSSTSVVWKKSLAACRIAALMLILVQLRAQASLAAEGWPSGKQRQANRSITLPLCPPQQIADSWILFNSGAIAALWKAKAVLPLRAATLKQQAMITRCSGNAASGKLVWNQHKGITAGCFPP